MEKSPEEFVDLLPELLAKAAKNKNLSPHEVARQFVLEQGHVRGGVEVLVVIDKQGQFVTAVTQDKKTSVNFPQSLQERLRDPKANLVIHHNHPPAEEPFFSDSDMAAIAKLRGVGWMLMHTEDSYSAMRTVDKAFYPDSSGAIPADGLPMAYKAVRYNGQYKVYNENPDLDLVERAGPELGLQALQQAGAIQHYSSIKTGIDHERERQIIQEIRSEATANAERAGGAAIWSGAESATPSPASGRVSGVSGGTGLSDTSTLEVEFKHFLDILSRQNTSTDDPAISGRPEPPKHSEAGGDNFKLESHRPTGRPLLETGLKGLKPSVI